MTITIKDQQEIEKMRVAGKLAADVLEMIEPHVKAGVTTDELNTLCAEYTEKVQGAISAPLNYHGFPKSICTSVNHVVCHGIPNDVPLVDGDIINIDITVIKDGYHGDTSKMFCIGETSPEDNRLCRITQEALYVGLKKVKPGNTFGESALQFKNSLKNRVAIRSSKSIVVMALVKSFMKSHKLYIIRIMTKIKWSRVCVLPLSL